MNALKPATRLNRLLMGSTAALAIALAIRITHNSNKGSQQTLAELQQSTHDHPSDAEAQLKLVGALIAQNRMREAEDAGKAAADLAPADTRPLNYLAQIAVSQHRTSEAIGYLQASLKIKQDDSNVLRAYGLLLQKQDPAAAWKALSQAAALETSESAKWLRAGMQEMEQQHNSQGLHDLQRAAALNPNDLVIQVELGAAARANDKPTLAADAFAKALSISPGNIPALLGSAAATLQVDPSSTGLARADTQLQQVMAVQPSADAYLVRGDLRMQQRRYAAAVTDLKTALKLDSRRYRAHSLLSQCYSALGDERLALSESAAYMESDSRAVKSLTAQRDLTR